VPGQTYRVIKAFTDYDGTVHPAGESWRFVKKSFLPYEDGLSLFVERNEQGVLIRLQWRAESQGEVIDNFSDFVEEMEKQAGEPPSPNQEPGQPPSRCLVWSAYALLIWSAAYGLLHLLWALGIGLFMLKPSALEIAYFDVANAITAVFLTAVGFLGLPLIHFRRQRFLSGLLLAISLLGCSLATSHGIYGIIHRILQMAGVVELESGPFHLMEHAYVLWDLVLFEPWFTIEGILLAVMGWCYLDGARSRRIWLLLCIVGTIAGLLTGLLGVRIG
jgi:hypothetical protein